MRKLSKIAIKGSDHSKFLHDGDKVDVCVGLETWQFYIDCSRSHLLLNLPPSFCGGHLGNGIHIRLWQQHRHLERSVAIRQAKSLIGIVFGIIECRHLPHHGFYGQFLSGSSMNEFFIFCVIFVKLLCPHTLEVNGIKQITDRTRIEFILTQYFFNHALRMVAGPLVDDIKRLAISKTATFWLCIIESLSR